MTKTLIFHCTIRFVKRVKAIAVRSLVSFLMIAVLFMGCSYSRKLEKRWEKTGLIQDFMYVYEDSVFMAGPHQWYIKDRKKDTVNVTDQWVRMNVAIGSTEVTNRQYNRFLESLKMDSHPDLYERYKPQAEGWTNLNTNKSYITYREEYSGDKYLDYPVVNISKEAVRAFIDWQNKIDRNPNVIYVLPTENEWRRSLKPSDWQDSTYAWGGYHATNEEGVYLGNFIKLNPEQLRYDQISDDMWFDRFETEGYQVMFMGPMKAYSYPGNEYAVYNMSGNVAEMITIPSDTNTEEAWTKGGSWRSPPFYGRAHAWEKYKLPSPCVGFRVLRYDLYVVNSP